MDIIVEIRRRHAVQKQSISAIAREMGLSRPTVRKHLTTVAEPSYERVQPVSLGILDHRDHRFWSIVTDFRVAPESAVTTPEPLVTMPEWRLTAP